MRTVFALLLFFNYFAIAQTGGRMREHHKNSGTHILKKQKSPWQYKKTPPSRGIQTHLFQRNRTYGKNYRAKILNRQNKERAKRRIRGNDVFAKRKY